MKHSSNILLSIAFICGLFLSGQANASLITVDAFDRGWYNNVGSHDPSNLNYIVGESGARIHRNFFVFDLSSVMSAITSAKLHLFNRSSAPPGLRSDTGMETYKVFNVTTAIATLVGGTGGVAAWNDLGGGVNYGSYNATAADNGTFVDIVLNDAALTSLNAASGLYALGGSITTLNGVVDLETLFTASHIGTHITQLILTTDATVPEPATLALMGLGLTGLGFSRRRLMNKSD